MRKQETQETDLPVRTKPPKTPEEKKVYARLAAQMICQGHSWDEVAAVAGYKNAGSAKRGLKSDPDVWDKEFQRAYDKFVLETVLAEAIQTQRDLMGKRNSTKAIDRKIAQAAAHSVFMFAGGLRRREGKLDVTISQAQKADDDLISDIRQDSDRLALSAGAGREHAVAGEAPGESGQGPVGPEGT